MVEGDHIEHLGHAFENTSTFVFYPGSLLPTPFGTVGELCFGGDQVAQGYLNEPALTASKFIAHPSFGTLYRSGDLGRMLPDGSILILGRLDDQVKLRGQRIDVGEISSLLTQTGLVSSSVVIPLSRSLGAPQQLVAFYAKSTSPNQRFKVLELPEEEKVYQHRLFSALEVSLPSYMVPSYLIPISVIPMTPSGKVAKAELRVAFQELALDALEGMSSIARVAVDGVSELSNDELRVMEAISSSLKVDRAIITRWSPLVTLGLDSITAISLAKSLSAILEKRVAISLVLQNPSVAQLTRALFTQDERSQDREELRQAAWLPKDEIIRSIASKFEDKDLAIHSILPCTALQEAMLASPLDDIYYNNIVLRLKVSPSDMEEYWKVMCARHSILRTCFMSTDDPDHAFVQVVLEEVRMPWQTTTGSSLSVDENLERMKKEVGSPVDTMIPPFALGVVFQDDFPYLCFFCHHAIYDGVAMTTLLQEVEMLANGISLLPPVSPEPFLREALSLPISTDAFWSEHFINFQPATFFSTEARASPAAPQSYSLRLDTPRATVEARCHSLNLSLLSVFQALWANLLAIMTGDKDVCFGNVLNGRTVPLDDIERLVAPCFNTIPFRVDLSAHEHNSSLFQHFQRVNPDILKYQFTPLRRIQRLLGHSHGLFNSLLLLQPPAEKRDDSVWELMMDSGGMDVPLVCEIVPDPVTDEITVTLHHDR